MAPLARDRRSSAFTALELLVVIVLLAVLSVVMIPVLMPDCSVPFVKEAQTNALNVAVELETHRAGVGGGSYSADGSATGCPGIEVYRGHGATVGELPIAIQGDDYAYTVEAVDSDGDGSCECFRIGAFARGELTVVREAGPIALDCHGTRTGPWRGPRAHVGTAHASTAGRGDPRGHP